MRALVCAAVWRGVGVHVLRSHRLGVKHLEVTIAHVPAPAKGTSQAHHTQRRVISDYNCPTRQCGVDYSPKKGEWKVRMLQVHMYTHTEKESERRQGEREREGGGDSTYTLRSFFLATAFLVTDCSPTKHQHVITSYISIYQITHLVYVHCMALYPKHRRQRTRMLYMHEVNPTRFYANMYDQNTHGMQASKTKVCTISDGFTTEPFKVSQFELAFCCFIATSIPVQRHT